MSLVQTVGTFFRTQMYANARLSFVTNLEARGKKQKRSTDFEPKISFSG
jgi:hypothetical protein